VKDSLLQYLSVLYRGTGRRLTVTIVLAALCSLTDGIGIVLLIPALQIAGVNLAGQGSLGRFAGTIDAALHRFDLTPSVPLLLLSLLLLLSARTVLVKMQTVAGTGVQLRIQVYLRERLHLAVLNADWLFLCRLKSSDLIHVFTGEVSRVGAATLFTLLLAGDLLVTVIYIVAASILSPGVTMVVLGAGLLLTIVLWERTRALGGVGGAITEKSQLLYAAIVDHVQNLKATKAYNAELRDGEVFAELNSEVYAVFNDDARRKALSSALFEIGAFVVLIVAIYGSIRVLAVSPAGILILLLIFARLMPRMVAAHAHYQSIVSHLPAVDSIVELEARCVAASPRTEPSFTLPPLRDRLELNHVSFAYPPAGAPVIADVTMTIEAGRTVAFVGASGSGKSTLADLIIGLLAPDTGAITIDGIALDASNAAGWRAQVGFVSQDTVLFHDTLRANLNWARPDATEDEMWQVLKMAAADEMVRRLPAGLDTVVGDRGVLFSHGERQRLAIARALLRKPALLVLDEATNSLDGDNEARVLDAIEKLHGSLTIILIAHRFSTVRRADAIYSFDRGRVAQSVDTKHPAVTDPGLDHLGDTGDAGAGVPDAGR